AGPQRSVLIGFFAINVHWIDIGGITPRSSDIFMEGLQLRSIKLWSRGEPIQEVYRIIENNTRFPVELLGDIAAQHAGCVLGRNLTQELADKYGMGTFLAALKAILDQSEAAARAHLAADAIARNPRMNVRELLDLDHIRAVLDRMLGDGSRRALHVVAVLSHVGWYEELQSEGESIARHLDQDWNTVRENVEEFHRRFGVVPRGGRYRYISPTPLGIYLAVEAWTIYPDLLKSLPSALPSDEARDAYYERLQTIASNPQAREFAREELSFFSSR